jgi:hypothetical protein
MDEGDRHFRKDDAVFKTLRKIVRRLGELGIAYAVAGGMALDAHGFRRLTVVVDILVTREGLKVIHERLEGLGYVPPSPRARTCVRPSTASGSSSWSPANTPATASPSPWPSPTRPRRVSRSTGSGI